MSIPQQIVRAVVPAGQWPTDQEVATITLTHGDRHRRRIRLTDDRGQPLLLDLSEATYLASGDGLPVDGGFLRVQAADEAVLDIQASSPAALARLAWHIGNRHTPMEVTADGALRLAADHVLAAMIRGLGGQVAEKQAPFNPLQGAYAGGGHHHHD